MVNYKLYAELFESFLNKQVQVQLQTAEPKNLYDPCVYMLQIGGKRIRPTTCLMAAALFDTSINEDTFWAAAAVELFHNFTLVHDDIMDGAPLRRGKETVYKKYSVTTAILSGDVLNILAYQCLQKVNNSNLQALLHLFNKTAIEVCEGQQYDMDFEQRDDVALAQYIEMIKLKTAVLLAASMKMGAICNGASEEQAQLLYQFGLNLGIAFQLQDDYLDSFGTQAAIGKQIGGDIQANKKTFLTIAAKASPRKSTFSQAELQTLSGDEKVAATLDWYRETEADKSCKEAIEAYTKRSLAALHKLNVTPERKLPFADLVTFLMNRES
jgi:geranylgeranyl diphosphate synthase type II